MTSSDPLNIGPSPFILGGYVGKYQSTPEGSPIFFERARMYARDHNAENFQRTQVRLISPPVPLPLPLQSTPSRMSGGSYGIHPGENWPRLMEVPSVVIIQQVLPWSLV